MANIPMVVLMRQAPAEALPTVVSSFPRTATLLVNASTTSGKSPQFVFSLPSANTTTIPTIRAFGPQTPGSSSPRLHWKLPPRHGPQLLVIGHAIMFKKIGFLFLRPIGALLARYMRTCTPIWFKGHWIVQFAVSEPIIVTGVALGIKAVVESGVNISTMSAQEMGSRLVCPLFLPMFAWSFHPLGEERHYINSATGYKTEGPKIGRGPLMAGAYMENKNNSKQKTYGEFFEATAFNDYRRGEKRAMGSPSSEKAKEHHAMMVEEVSPTELYND
ncbi:hypothetical protein EV368DRAFT_89540 [Lentinula lateritia]|nr:hypothetical protein EV368DRAFT_89540 [Lentinula lateritia]